MNIQTHKHFVAIPLVAVIALAIAGVDHVLTGNVASYAQMQQINAQEESLTFETTIGLSGFLKPQSSATIDDDGFVILDRGAMMLRAQRAGHITYEHIGVTFFLGAVSIMQTEEIVTVVAIDVPALIVIGNNTFLLPTGYQVRIPRMPDPQTVYEAMRVPSIWYSSVASDLEAIAQEEMTVARLSDPEKRALYSSMQQRDLSLAELQSVLAQFPSAEYTPLDAMVVMDSAKRTGDDVASLLGLTLSGRTHYPKTMRHLLAPITDNAPIAWTEALLVTAEHADLPRDDTFRGVLHDLLRRSAAQDASEVAEWLPDIADLIARYDREGYPQSAEKWLQTFEDTADFVLALLPESEHAAVYTARSNARNAVAIVHEDLYASAQQQFVPVRETIDQDYARSLTLQALREAGLLFTVDTEVTPIAPDHTYVHVRGVYADTTPLEFTYDTQTGLAGNIVKDGKKQPNSVELDLLGQ